MTHQFLNDLRFALRMFRRNPGTTTVAALSLALAIGPNSAIFSAADRLMLKPLPVEGPNEIYQLSFRTEKQGIWESPAYPDLPDYREPVRGAMDLFAFDRMGTMVSAEGETQLLQIAVVSENYFPVLKLRPAAGRLLTQEDAHAQFPPPVVISYGLWQRKFAGSARAIGKTVLLRDRACYIAGVAPRGFGGPSRNIDLFPPDVWIGFQGLAGVETKYRAALADRAHQLTVMARLRAGVPPAQVEAMLSAVAERLGREHAATNKARAAVLNPIMDPGRVRIALVLLSLVGMVLLIACANLAGVFLAHAETRQREFAIRLAVGAWRGRLMRQLMTESLLLSVFATGLGLLFALWLMALLPAMQPKMIFRVDLDLQMNFRVVAYTVFITIAASLAAGLIPALRVSRADLAPLLKGESAGGGERFRLRWSLIVAQIAVSQFLLTGAGLLGRSYLEVRKMRPGFDPDRKVLLATLIPSRRNVNIDSGAIAVALRAIPGVRRVSSVGAMPLGFAGTSTRQVTAGDEPVEVSTNSAGPELFTMLGAQMLRGRDFSEHDAPGAAIVNEAMARRFWGSADAAVGRFFRVGAQDCHVVGVVETGKYHQLMETPLPYLFLFARGEGTLVIETARDPGALADSIRETLHEAAPDALLANLNTLRQHMRVALFPWQLVAGLFGVTALLGIFLAGVGLYGLVSYGVNRRAHEIGVRMAMGAKSEDVLRLIMRQALTMVAVGAAIGLACAFVAARLVSAMLYRVGPADPAGVLASIVAVALVTVIAAQGPARRALRVDPINVLRQE